MLCRVALSYAGLLCTFIRRHSAAVISRICAVLCLWLLPLLLLRVVLCFVYRSVCYHAESHRALSGPAALSRAVLGTALRRAVPCGLSCRAVPHRIAPAPVVPPDQELVRHVDTVSRFYWLLLSDKTHGDHIVRTLMLPVLAQWGKRHMPIEFLKDAVEWAAQFEERHGPFVPFLSKHEAFIRLHFKDGEVSLTPAGRAAVTFGASANSSGETCGSATVWSSCLNTSVEMEAELVEAQGWTFISRSYLHHIRQQISRAARKEGEVWPGKYGNGRTPQEEGGGTPPPGPPHPPPSRPK